ncbi:unnamed protein product [Vitrella brassicaformis CCMP3155]|uniref:UDP-glycosyltransferases domain-containing protein n=1 Tax=Vitrella brassicaformis (strain CCMP3155) TaxID=1169540 RepID=A0A0G4H1D2_VITBC|nr:unnamed protein product [Vitrella brassicaformis CCMP3155]|eukprot:CEM37395.1 unnamed protein product [Vitrella brassicaformis CCMP3155]
MCWRSAVHSAIFTRRLTSVQSCRGVDTLSELPHLSRSAEAKWRTGLTFVSLGVLTQEDMTGGADPNRVGLRSFLDIITVFRNLNKALEKGLEKHFPLNGSHATHLPDLVLAGIGASAAFDFAFEREIPAVYSHPTVSLVPMLSPPWPYLPPFMTGFSYDEPTVLQRVAKMVYFAVVSMVGERLEFPFTYLMSRRAKSVLKMVHSFPGLDYPFHTPPLLQYTGALLRPESLSPDRLDPSVRKWLDASSLPVVYVSFGSLLHIEERMGHTLMEAFSGPSPRPYRVLWALGEKQWAELPPRDQWPSEDVFHLATWVATPAALAHEKVKVFLSHCGANGVHEAIYAGTPIVGIPHFGDQLDVGLRLKRAGVGLMLDRHTMTAADVRHAIAEVMSNASFAERTAHLQATMKLYGGVERAADLVEYVYSMGGDLSHWETPAERLPFYRALGLDLIAAACFLVSVKVVLFGACLRRLCCSRRSAAVSKQKAA